MFTIASFEFRARLRLLSTWVYFLVFFAMSLALSAAAGGLFKSAHVSFGSDKVFINSPYALGGSMCVLAMFGIVVIAAVMGRAVQQDFEYRMQSFFFTAPISKLAYLGGRFLGGLAVCVVILSSVALASWLATFLPGMDATRIGPNRLLAYLLPYVFIIIPNVFLIGGVFFSVAALSRKMLPVYIGSVLLLLGWLVSLNLYADMENKTLAAMIDPFGLQAQSVLTEYWTVSERNARLLVLDGVLLWNRVLWAAVGLAVITACAWRFSFAQAAVERLGKGRRAMTDDEPPPLSMPAAEIVLKVRPVALLRALTRLYLSNIVRDVYFGVLVFAGVLFLFVSSTTLGDIYGTTTWPVTSQVIGLVSGSFSLFMLVIITFYAGELVWREREVNVAQIVDATPVPTWVPFLAKLAALMVLPMLLQFVLMLGGISIQLFKGYTHFELGLWFYGLFTIELVHYWLICALALTVQSLVNQKYLGHFVMIVYYIALLASGSMGFEDNLYKIGYVPAIVYSDMNGYGEGLFRSRVFEAYWSAASIVLLALAYLFWVRGTVTGWRGRLSVARQRLTPFVAAYGLVATAAFCALGGFIFYNTHVLNEYESSYSNLKLQADYEKKYKATALDPEPKATKVSVDVDLYPKEQRVRSRGEFVLENKTMVPIRFVTLTIDVRGDVVVHQMAFDVPSQLVVDDATLGVRRYQLTQPLAPGASTILHFDLESMSHGFRNQRTNTAVVGNGSFFPGSFIMPQLGYQEHAELDTDRDRRKFDLAPKPQRMRDRDDPVGLARNYITGDGDWIDFSARVTTDADQIAIAPGYLQSDVTKDARRTFSYQMDVPILDFVAFQSARYAVKHDVWHDPINHRDVALEIYYQPGHEFDLASMFASSKAALAYCSENFSPYQHRQLRIVEFPRYATFAQSFPNTVPFSEALGFIARVRPNDEKDIDYPYYVTAHEVAHQWWAHQVVGGNVQGTTVLSETLAQYSALMVMKQKFGEAKMRRFLSYELDRYLIGRSTEQQKELPLGRNEDQGYIHYRKGSLVMYTLQDYIGEAKVNEALKAFLEEHAYKGAPYPNSKMLVDEFRKVTPPDMQYLLDDMFDRIVVYDNRAVSAQAKALPNGTFDVTINVKVKKVVADGEGKETELAPNDLIEIGVLDADGKPLYLKKERITTTDASFTVNVAHVPTKAGVDPLNELIDRTPSDNTIAVEMK